MQTGGGRVLGGAEKYPDPERKQPKSAEKQSKMSRILREDQEKTRTIARAVDLALRVAKSHCNVLDQQSETQVKPGISPIETKASERIDIFC